MGMGSKGGGSSRANGSNRSGLSARGVPKRVPVPGEVDPEPPIAGAGVVAPIDISPVEEALV